MTAPRGTPVLETERLRLRPAMFEDAEAPFPELARTQAALA